MNTQQETGSPMARDYSHSEAFTLITDESGPFQRGTVYAEELLSAARWGKPATLDGVRITFEPAYDAEDRDCDRYTFQEKS